MDNEHSGKVAVITGGGRGFGKAFGTALAQKGATVCLIDMDSAAVTEAAAEIGGSTVGLSADVTHEGRMGEICSEIAHEHGGIDILINNAGLHSHE